MWHSGLVYSSPMDPGLIEVVVEIPRGSRNKYEFDKQRGVLVLDPKRDNGPIGGAA